MLPPIRRAQLVEEIQSHYRAMGPRLILADALEESIDPADQAEAEFIRIQCALNRLPFDHPRRIALVHRESELLQQYRELWSQSMRPFVSPESCEFRCGLLDGVAIDAQLFVKHGSELLKRAPIRRIRLLDAGRHLAQWIQCPTLAKILEIDLCGCDLGNCGLADVLRSPHLESLQFLDLGSNGLCSRSMHLLAQSQSLPDLRELNLHMNPEIDCRGVQQFVASTNFQKLRTLDLSWNSIQHEGIEALVDARDLKRLRTVRLFQNPLGDRGIQKLIESQLFQRMAQHSTHLDFRHNEMGTGGVEFLVRSPHLQMIRSLDLSGNTIGDAGIRALVQSENLPRLRRLSLCHNRLTDQGASLLASSQLMTQLRFLDISSNQIGNCGVDRLWKSRRRWDTEIDWSDTLASFDVPSSPDL